jgi:hypothetical protein
MRSVLTWRTHNEIERQSAYITVRGSVNARSTWFAHLGQLLILKSNFRIFSIGVFSRCDRQILVEGGDAS